MMKKLLMLGTAVPLLFLTACGDGWEMRPYNNTPYGDRTAGSGVEYVRAHMMPEKGPVLQPVIQPEPEAAPIKEEEPVVEPIVNSGEKYFHDAVRK